MIDPTWTPAKGYSHADGLLAKLKAHDALILTNRRRIVQGAITITPVEDTGAHHFVAAFPEPGRIEVTVSRGGAILAYTYKGAEVDTDQEPLDVYEREALT